MGRDADGQMRGHLSDRMVEDGKGERVFWLVGGKLHLGGYFWVYMCASLFV